MSIQPGELKASLLKNSALHIATIATLQDCSKAKAQDHIQGLPHTELYAP